MTIRNTAYETTACHGYVTTKLVHALEDAYVSGYFSASSKNHEVKIIDYTSNTTPVPAFMHPVVVERDGKKIVFVDVRSSGKYDEAKGEFKVRNPFENEFITVYGELNNFWINDNPKLLSSVSHLPAALYARWLSENITRRFGLNPQDQLSIAILAAFFYLGQFTNEDEVDLRDLQRMCGIISKSVYVKADMVLNVIEKRPYIKSVAEFIETIKEVTGNVRLNDLNVGTLFSILGNTWYGTNHVELVCAALEFPPAWILLTYASYNDRSYKNTGIAKMSVRDKKVDIDIFVKSLVTMIRHV